MTTDRIAGAAQEVGGIVEEAAGRITGNRTREALGVLHRASGVARSAKGQVHDRIDEASEAAYGAARVVRENAGRFVEDTSKRATEVYEDGRRVARDSVRTVRHQVEENPFTALLVAGAVGYLLSLLVHGRR